ncbi:MAG: hypothetical protein HY774_10470 [Acidobacteria bacterium]|nr:hypothetical protein [Acidobacteriota bacterium]
MANIRLTSQTKAMLGGALFLVSLGVFLYSVVGVGQSASTPTAQAKKYPDRIPAKDLESGKGKSGAKSVNPAASPSGILASGSLIESLASLDLPQFSKSDTLPQEMRNLWVYPPPPPPPQEPPPPPPTITLHTASPTSVFAGTDQPVELVVRGTPFREGLQIYFRGSPLQTHYNPSGELTARLSPGIFAQPGSVTIEVKDPMNAEDFSTSLPFQIQAPPKPSVQSYIGWTRGKSQQTGEAIVLGPNESGNSWYVLRINDGIDNRFRVVEITDRSIKLQDTQLSGVYHTYQLTTDSSNTASFGSSQPSSNRGGGGGASSAYSQYGQPSGSAGVSMVGSVDPNAPVQKADGQEVGSGLTDANGNPLSQEQVKQMSREELRAQRQQLIKRPIPFGKTARGRQ